MRSIEQQIIFWTDHLRRQGPEGVREAFRRAGMDPEFLVVASFDGEDYLLITPELRVLEVGYGFVDGGPGFHLSDNDRLSKLPILIDDLTDSWGSHPLREEIAIAVEFARNGGEGPRPGGDVGSAT